MEARQRIEERKKALEEKRKRLEEIRRNKAGRASATRGQSPEPSRPRTRAAAAAKASTVAASASRQDPPAEDDGPDLDALVEGLLSKPPRAPTPDPQGGERPEDAPADAQGGEQAAESTKAAPAARPRPVLSRVADVGVIDVPFRQVECYDKGVQTDPFDLATLLDGTEDGLGEVAQRRARKSTVSESQSDARLERSSSVSGGQMHGELRREGAVQTDDMEPSMPAVQTVDSEERELIEQDPDFQSFLAQSERVVERAMKQNGMFDVAVDYGGKTSVNTSVVQALTEVQTIQSERWSKDRTITAIECSPHHKELFLSAHAKRQASGDLDWSRGSAEPGGVVLLWSMHMASERPEYVFTCESPVHTAKFHPFAPNLVVGGTYSGQIVMWDLRAKSAPVQRSMLSQESHTHPVYAMAITGTENAHSLTSVSTDGRMCQWSLANLSQPTESRQLKHNKKDVTATALAFGEGETNEFCIGTEDGRLLKAQVHGTKTGVEEAARDGHFGPVTHLDFNRAASTLSDLMLSCSMDWTVKLWSQRQGEVPLASFETSKDYVFDAKWSPVHPALFASANGSGMLDLWNLNADLEVPQARAKVSSCALSALQWVPGGRRILAGDARGRVHLYDVATEFAVPRANELSRLENRVTELSELAALSVTPSHA